VALDSVALARDSVLDAMMLDRIASANAPEAEVSAPTAPTEGELATLRSMFDIDVANFEDHGRVRYWLDFFSGPARERMAIWLTRMPRYEPTIRSLLMARGLPGDLAYLPLIESGYSATAVSRSRAVGMWQFMRATGKFYGLAVDAWVDERRDVPKATNAAIRYLADLTTRFGSPYLAAAAYNGGPGRIQRGLARMEPGEEDAPATEEGEDGSGADGSPQAGDIAFFQLADTRFIRQETKDYVPKLIAAAMIAKQPERYGFPPLAALPPLAPDSVVVNDATGLDVIARVAGVPLIDVGELNPAFLRALTPPKRRSVVRLPAGVGATTQAALEALPTAERLSSFPHHAKAGESLTALGKRYTVSVSQLREFNPEFAAHSAPKGAIIRIPGQARLAGWVSENKKIGLADIGGGLTHRVRKGETVGGIARRYHVSVAQLRSWNRLRSASVIRVGQLLRVAPGGSAHVARSAAGSAGFRVHIVRTGDTLSSLARRYRVSVEALRLANGLGVGHLLPAGRRLTIPS
jgi:membrane-bound lytic murein transglycosylase D